MPILQPADWHEHDHNGSYVIDVYGRMADKTVACLRITGFKPYFYSDRPIETSTRVSKYDAMAGFNELKKKDVYKVECKTRMQFHMNVKQGKLKKYSLYESNLHPFLRLFHERHLGPASPIEFTGRKIEIPEDDNQHKLYNVDSMWSCSWDAVSLADSNTPNIPLLIACYDLEMYSESGLFPQSKQDPICQMGLSYRWSDSMMESLEKQVFVLGSVKMSDDPKTTFVACDSEEDMIRRFHDNIRGMNPDVICGYNTFGFDDAYLEDRCMELGISDDIHFPRCPKDLENRKFSETKKMELASGKYDLRMITMTGRLTIDLLLNMRRDHSLESFKLDHVATHFLKGKVTKQENNLVSTYTTRGLHNGNYVTFNFVETTSEPCYEEGEKFEVYDVQPGSFRVKCDEILFSDFTPEEFSKLHWSFAKDDLSPQELFDLHAKGGAAGRARIAKYCIQDCDLVLCLMHKLDTLVNTRGMADVCKVPMNYVLTRGQGIKIFSAVVYYASQRDQIILTQEAEGGEGIGYEGAIVLEPKIGMYLDQPISVLDFNSLYPSNMIAYNLSPDTLVYERVLDSEGFLKQPSKEQHLKIKSWIEGLEQKGFVFEEISYDNKDTGGKTVCTFVQKGENPMTTGVIPLTLDILLKKRKEFKQKMEDETNYDESQRSVFNGLQLAYKVVANSVYGQAGSRTSPIRKTCVAACTTAAGRNALYTAKRIVESEFGAEVIYGDSVAGYTPIAVRIGGRFNIVSIEEIGLRGEWRAMEDGKEFCELADVESWTETGWTPMLRIIRHTLAPHKKMVRVLTHTGLVDVTDDHSLLRPNGEAVSSTGVAVGDELLHAPYPPATEYETDDVNKARIAGFFAGDGSCGFYACTSGNKASWALNNANPELLETYQGLCQKVYPELEWTILPTLVSSGVYKLVPQGRGVQMFVCDYREMMYVGQRKTIPDWVLNGTRDIRQAFWDGFYDADGDKDMGGYVRIDQKHQTTCALLAWLGASLGYIVSLNTRDDKPMICRMTFTKHSQRKNTNAIKKVHEIAYEGYVYDLTTSNHHFQAGVGQMIVHNTDSIFIQFPSKQLVDCIKLGIEAGKRITGEIGRHPYKIAYEKTLYPFILFCRKRYVGMKYEEDPNPAKAKQMSMGVVLKRRDNAPIVKDVFGGALKILMSGGGVKKAQAFVNDMLLKIFDNKVALEKFIVSKSLRDDYAAMAEGYDGRATLPAHRVLADRMAKRDPGTAPKVGDRLQYIYVAENKHKSSQGDRIEHVDYVKANKLTPDTQFYITNQIQNPLAQLFALCVEQLDGYVPPKKPTFEELKKQYLVKFAEDEHPEEEATLAVLKKKEAYLDSLMFLGSPALSKKVRASVRGPMDAFMSKEKK